MIFYTLTGPKYKLEIHDDRIKLIKRVWWSALSRKDKVTEFKLDELTQFQISIPKIIWGKLDWAMQDGTKCSFRFSTNSLMMGKIEKYMHKLIIKNIERRQNVLPFKKHKFEKQLKEAA